MRPVNVNVEPVAVCELINISLMNRRITSPAVALVTSIDLLNGYSGVVIEIVLAGNVFVELLPWMQINVDPETQPVEETVFTMYVRPDVKGDPEPPQLAL